MASWQVVLLLLLLAAVAAVGSTAGCGGDQAQAEDPKLAALEAEQLATFRPPHGKLVGNLVLGEQDGFKPTVAQIDRAFAFPSADLARAGRNAVSDAAVASGWRLNLERDEPGEPIFGGKHLETGDATVIIGTYPADRMDRVSVRLEHQPCPPERCGGG